MRLGWNNDETTSRRVFKYRGKPAQAQPTSNHNIGEGRPPHVTY